MEHNSYVEHRLESFLYKQAGTYNNSAVASCGHSGVLCAEIEIFAEFDLSSGLAIAS